MTWFDVFLTNIELSLPGATDLLTKVAIAVARSMIPGTLSAVDKTMEETFMKFAKSQGGVIGLLNKFAAYQRWCCTTSLSAKFFERMLELCDMLSDTESPKDGKYRELQKTEVKRSEEAVQKTMTAIQSFTNPFTIPDKGQLYCLSSGAAASPEVEVDILRADVAKAEVFIKQLRCSSSSA